MGINSPITAAGYQAMGAAGQLAALVLTQLIREGTPFVVRGGRIVVSDMKTMLPTFADPGNRIFSAEMARFYNLPCFGTAGCSDSKQLDWQTVSEASLTLFADSLARGHLIHDVGYIESGLTYSAEMLVLCDEIISWIKSFKRGALVNEDTLALNLIDELGFDGDFLTSDHTLSHYKEQWEPRLFDRQNFSRWQDMGSVGTKENVYKTLEEILSTHKCRELPLDVKQKLAEITSAVLPLASG